MRVETKRFSIATRVTVMVLIMVVLSSASIGAFSYAVYRSDSIRYQGQRALAAAGAMASMIDVKQFLEIAETEEKTAYYHQIQERFTRANQNMGTLYLYSMVKDEDGIHYKYVFAAVTNLDNPLLGGKDTIKSYGKYALQAYNTGKQVISDIYDNEGYGLMVSAFFPLFDIEGNIAGLVCADIKADGVIASINDYRNKVILAALLFVLLFGITSVSYSLHLFGKAKQAEDKAKKLAAIVSVADAGVVVKDRNGVITEWNIGAENILGYTAEEAAGKTARIYAPPGDYEKMDQMDARLMKGEHIAHVEVVRMHKDGSLVDCAASFTPILNRSGVIEGSVAIFHDITDKKQIELSLQKAHKTILSGMQYASKIQRNLLPPKEAFEEAFRDFATIWKPRDIVGGDIYWLKNFEDGTLLCVCDCTGHGTPGALLTVFVISALESFVNETNHKDTANVIWELDQRLYHVLNSGATNKDIKDGCDLAVLWIPKKGDVTISSGNMRVFICDGVSVTQMKGQRIFVGEGRVEKKQDIKVTTVPANSANKFYIASDGLFDQTGGENDLPFGYKKVTNLILEYHEKPLSVIAESIWRALEEHRGESVRVDDFELITFQMKEE